MQETTAAEFMCVKKTPGPEARVSQQSSLPSSSYILTPLLKSSLSLREEAATDVPSMAEQS